MRSFAGILFSLVAGIRKPEVRIAVFFWLLASYILSFLDAISVGAAPLLVSQCVYSAELKITRNVPNGWPRHWGRNPKSTT
jgi:hypothetical protein